MIKVEAIKELKQNGEIVGYRLRDGSGKEMDIQSSAIISAIKNGQVEATNLTIKNECLTWNQSTDKARIVELTKLLNEARKVYEQGSDEIMSNFEYDKLYDELEELENKTGYSMPNSPTRTVGYEIVSKLEKEKHDTPMLSLAKTKDIDELKSFLGNRDGALSWKLDGLTVVLKYEDGKFVKGITRGNGEIGEVVTNNVKQFKNVPMEIEYKGKLTIRGEAVIRYSTFNRINAAITADDEKYKNPRNLCSGSVRQLDSGITAKRDVEWHAFELVEGPSISKTVSGQLDWLSNLGFDVVDSFVVTTESIDMYIKLFSDRLNGLDDIEKFDIPTDGLVLTYNDVQYRNTLGQTSKSPKHSKAFKWQDTEAETTLEYIDWSTSRNGLITPVAVFKPVDIEGSTVSRASVHNVSIFKSLRLGIGDRLKVYKANLIIPQISENLDQTGTCHIPGLCPCCDEPTELHEEPSSGVLTLWCTNPDCSARGNRSLEHFVSRDAMNIDGISGATLSKLCDEGIVTDFVSIYHIKDYEEEIVNLEGFGEQSFNKMVNAIEKSRDVKLANLIYALGIQNVGLATAKLICKHFAYDIEKTATASEEQLVGIDGIGDTIAESFCDYFADEENQRQFIGLLKELRIVKEEVSTNKSMDGVTICVTGGVEVFPNRRAIKDLVESLGGKLTGSVSRSTSYLVTNDTESGSDKNRKAKEYGIEVLTEQQFIDKFGLEKYV